MLAITILINVLWIPLIVLVSACGGFLFRSQQILKAKKQVSSLEREMLNNHAEILALQQELVKLEKKQTASKSLVVSMKEVSSEENTEANTDVSSRKKAN